MTKSWGVVISAALALVMAGAGCGMEVQDYTRLVSRGMPAADPGSATLVIMRRGGIGEMLQVMDAQGHLLAQVRQNSWVRIPLSPGHQRIYAMMGTERLLSSVVDIDAAPGMIYYASTPRTGVLWAVAPRHEDRWRARHEWITEGNEAEVDPARLELFEAEVPAQRRSDAIAACEEGWARMDEAHRADFTLLATDGVPQH